MRPTFLLIAMVVLTAAPLGARVFSGEPEVWVDDDYTPQTPGWGVTAFNTVQGGIDAVIGGGTVHVLAGRYTESTVVDHPLNLIGENKETAILAGGGLPTIMVTVLSGGAGTLIESLTFKNSKSKAILVEGANGLTVKNCLFHDNGWGVFFTNSSGISVTKNEFTHSVYSGLTITSEEMSLRDFSISQNVFTNNEDHGISIRSDDHFVIDKVVLSDNIVEDGSSVGILLRGVIHSSVIHNTISGNVFCGIYLDTDSTLNRISENRFIDQESTPTPAIWMIHSHSNLITDNISEGSESFCEMRSNCSNNTVSRNIILNGNGTAGIWLRDYSSVNLITGNVIEGFSRGVGLDSGSNVVQGNFLSRNYKGVDINSTDHNSILENTILLNQEYGISIYRGEENWIENNIMAWNFEYGLYLYQEKQDQDNRIVHNAFISNGVANAFDNHDNQWDDGYPSGGNYWDDFTGEDSDGDGIGDRPYEIATDGSDPYPLMAPLHGGALFADEAVLSVSRGGAIAFQLQSGSIQSRRPYLILGGKSGIEPGIPLPGGAAVLPINWDGFTDFVISHLNSAVFVDFLSKLDLDGHGKADLVVSPGSIPATWIGSTLYFAYMLDFPYDAVSNPVKILIVE